MLTLYNMQNDSIDPDRIVCVSVYSVHIEKRYYWETNIYGKFMRANNANFSQICIWHRNQANARATTSVYGPLISSESLNFVLLLFGFIVHRIFDDFYGAGCDLIGCGFDFFLFNSDFRQNWQKIGVSL